MATPDFLEVVEPPPPLMPSTSLLTGLPPITDDSRWERGIRHMSGRGLGPYAPDDPGTPTDVTVTDLACTLTESVSLVLVAPELRPGQSMWANARSYDDRVASARLNMERGQSFVIARELMYGTVATAKTWPTPFLRKAPIAVTATAQKPATALSWLLDTWQAGHTAAPAVRGMLGERGVIHAAPAVLRALATRGGYVEQRGNQFVEIAMGFPIVTDAGYIGANNTSLATVDSIATTQWMFLSPNVQIRLSPMRAVPATVNWKANTETVWVDRVANYTWEIPATGDTALSVLAIPVDLT